jgi:hypothetical protein
MKRIALPSLFVLLSAVLCLGRTVSDDSTANAIKGVHRLQESLRNPASLQISRAVVTAKGICLEYLSRNGSGGMSTGFAVYKTDKDLVWVDNSWLWDQVCLDGKYGQRRDGKDVTDAVNAATENKQASTLKGQLAPSALQRGLATVPAVQLVVPAARVERLLLNTTAPAVAVAPKAVVSGQPAQTVPLTASGVTSAPTAQTRAASVAPAPAATMPVAQANAVAVPVETPGPTARAPVAVAAAPASAQASALSHTMSSAPVGSVELGTIRGVTIVDNRGALERKGPPPAPESLGGAARRLRRSKQQ